MVGVVCGRLALSRQQIKGIGLWDSFMAPWNFVMNVPSLIIRNFRIICQYYLMSGRMLISSTDIAQMSFAV